MKKVFLLFFLINSSLLAYPNFIGYGYTSCLTCHYNPFGNGPLTDYGRAVGTTSIVSDTFYGGKDSDLEARGKKSGFMYSEPLNQWLRPSIDYRGLYLKNSIGEDSSQTEYIHMDANINLVLRLGPKENRDKFIISATMGYAPEPRSGAPSDADTYRSREHYIGYRFTPAWGLYAGLMDKVYGIRIPDHIAYGRSVTQNTMNDQTHGLLLHYTNPNWDIGLQAFVGNLAEEETVRQKGFAATAEYTYAPQIRPGASVQMSESEFLKTYSYALHSRIGFGKGNSIMGEIGQTNEELPLRGTENQSRYWTVQAHVLASKGFFLLNTIEYLKADLDEDNKRLRWGPGIQWFLYQGVEWRMDFYNTRVHSENAVTQDEWDFTTQVHLWF